MAFQLLRQLLEDIRMDGWNSRCKWKGTIGCINSVGWCKLQREWRFNLCLQERTSSCYCVRETLALTSELASLIRASPKQLGLFEGIQSDLAPDNPGLKPLCPTRWTICTAASNAVIKNYTLISCELETIGKETYGEPRKSCGLLAMMDKFGVYFGLNSIYTHQWGLKS